MRNSYQTNAPSSPADPVLLNQIDTLNWIVPPTDDRHSEITPDDLVFGWSLVQMYGEYTSISGRPATAMPALTLPQRLAFVLLALSNDDEYEPMIENVSTADLASALGSSRESVAALLRAFRRQKLIDIQYGIILLLDMEALREISA